ncbi:4907_t:CDS:2 [Diversispora eburnea]|uniref:4907_t:CDS:1 n=1 Tax=Diversispora eburnea TaxID=1213867 RepID=A0A9N8WFN6_9GLOM|nr:4907_t:CDS:2 [Diversispora eburnea]
MSLQTRANNLLGNLNVHPPPTLEDVVNSKNFRRFPRRRIYTGYKLLRFVVARQSNSLGERDPLVISKLSDFLWANSTSNEKARYIDLANRAKLYHKNLFSLQKF